MFDPTGIRRIAYLPAYPPTRLPAYLPTGGTPTMRLSSFLPLAPCLSSPRFSRRLASFKPQMTAATPSPKSAPSLSPLSLRDPTLLCSGSFIANTFTQPSHASAAEVAVQNPATNQTVHRVTQATDRDIDTALTSATSAFHRWRRSSLATRSAFLRKWHALMMEHKEDLARIITVENGKTLREARAEVEYGASFIEWNILEMDRGEGTWVTRRDAGVLTLVLKEAVGVCVVITPWNFPIAMLTRKVGAAIAAGCSVVAKPSHLTPLSALALAELGRRAGLEEGVLNVVVTEQAREVVERMLGWGGVRMVSFTGSTAVGKSVGRVAAGRVLKCSLELGGCAPFVVFEDADLEKAVGELVKNKMRGSGQTCVALNRVYVEKGVVEEFCGRVREVFGGLRMGNGLEEGVDYGPLVNEQGWRKVKGQVEDAVRKGAEVVVGGHDGVEAGGEGRGWFYPATLLRGVTEDMAVAGEETFGPVVGVMEFDGEEELMGRVRAGESGLAGYLFTKDMGRIQRVAGEMEVGMVGVNCVGISGAATRFGGVKESGLGREGGRGGVEAFLEEKFVMLKS